jgi:hypothetical protein
VVNARASIVMRALWVLLARLARHFSLLTTALPAPLAGPLLCLAAPCWLLLF